MLCNLRRGRLISLFCAPMCCRVYVQPKCVRMERQMQSNEVGAGMRSIFTVQQLSVHQALSCACIGIMHIWVPHWKWTTEHNASSIDVVWCSISSAHQKQNIPAHEAVNEELECAACSHPHPPFTTDSIDYSTWSTTFQQSHRHKFPKNSTRDTTRLSHSDSPNFRTPHIEGQEQVQSHISHKSAHHRIYQTSPNTSPPGVGTPNSRTYTMQEASGRERFSGKNLNKCPQKIPKKYQTTPLQGSTVFPSRSSPTQKHVQ